MRHFLISEKFENCYPPHTHTHIHTLGSDATLHLEGVFFSNFDARLCIACRCQAITLTISVEMPTHLKKRIKSFFYQNFCGAAQQQYVALCVLCMSKEIIIGREGYILAGSHTLNMQECSHLGQLEAQGHPHRFTDFEPFLLSYCHSTPHSAIQNV